MGTLRYEHRPVESSDSIRVWNSQVNGAPHISVMDESFFTTYVPVDRDHIGPSAVAFDSVSCTTYVTEPVPGGVGLALLTDNDRTLIALERMTPTEARVLALMLLEAASNSE